MTGFKRMPSQDRRSPRGREAQTTMNMEFESTERLFLKFGSGDLGIGGDKNTSSRNSHFPLLQDAQAQSYGTAINPESRTTSYIDNSQASMSGPRGARDVLASKDNVRQRRKARQAREEQCTGPKKNVAHDFTGLAKGKFSSSKPSSTLRHGGRYDPRDDGDRHNSQRRRASPRDENVSK